MTHCPNTGTMKAIGIDKPLAEEGRNGVNHGAPTGYPGQQGAIPVPVPKAAVPRDSGSGGEGERGFVWIGFPVAGTDGQRPTGNNPAFPASRSHSSIPPLKRRAARGTPPELTMLQQLHLHGAAHPWRLQDSFPELGKKCVHRRVHRSALSLPTLPTSDADRLTTSVPSRHLPGSPVSVWPGPRSSRREVWPHACSRVQLQSFDRAVPPA